MIIISTNDIHGKIDNIARLATMVKEYRAQDTARVILVDMGDRWTGNAYVDGAKQTGKPIIDLMNDIGYDVVTFGNHEFDRGQDTLAKRMGEGNFGVVLANMEKTSDASPLQQPEPYVVMNVNGTDIAFVGVITNFANGHPDGNAISFENLAFTTPIESMQKVGNLHRRADVVVAMSHAGDDRDMEMAEALPDYFDIILGGHTHVNLDTLIGNTPVGQAGAELEFAGVTMIRLCGDKVTSIEYNTIPLNTYADDEAIAARVEEFENVPELRVKVGNLTGAMTREEGEVNFFSDVMRDALKSDISLQHIGGVRIKHGVSAGVVERHVLFEMDPFASRAVRLTMSLNDVKRLILTKFNDKDNIKESHKEDMFPSGMTYTILVDKSGEGYDVVFEGIDSDLTKLRSVAVSDYIYNNYNFDGIERAEKLDDDDFSKIYPELFEAYFKRYPNFKPDNNRRVRIRRD